MTRLHEMGCSSRLAAGAECDCHLRWLTPDVERVLQQARRTYQPPRVDLAARLATLLEQQIAVFDAQKVLLQQFEAIQTAQGAVLRTVEDLATLVALTEPSHEQ